MDIPNLFLYTHSALAPLVKDITHLTNYLRIILEDSSSHALQVTSSTNSITYIFPHYFS